MHFYCDKQSEAVKCTSVENLETEVQLNHPSP